jgi:arylformamidase
MKIIDISPLVSEATGVFPGDTAFRRSVALDFKQGHNLLLSSIQTTLHIGAHADAPNHYSPQGAGVDERDLSRYLGHCLVLHANVPRGVRVSKSHFGEKWKNTSHWPSARILVRTDSFPDPDNWNSDFCSFDPGLIKEWAEAGVKLIGIDTPSIDPEDSKALEAHNVVARYDLAILEGLILGHVPEGYYTLLALPLKLKDADAAPVRAVLLEDPSIFGAQAQ